MVTKSGIMKIRVMVILFAVVICARADETGIAVGMQRPFNPSPMPLLPSLFRSSSPRRDDPGLAWRRQDFTMHSLGQEEQIVSVRGGVPDRFPGFVVDFAHDCESFLPLDEHIAEHADKHAWG